MRKFISGETKYAGSTAYYCIVVFKFEFDLVKCFRDDFLQELASREHKEEKAGEADREDYQNQLITTYLADELKDVSKLEELHKEGYNVITNKQGEFKVDYEANQKCTRCSIQPSKICPRCGVRRRNRPRRNCSGRSWSSPSDHFPPLIALFLGRFVWYYQLLNMDLDDEFSIEPTPNEEVVKPTQAKSMKALYQALTAKPQAET